VLLIFRFNFHIIACYHKFIYFFFLNVGSNNDPSKLSTQTQASQMQQMQSAVQLLTQGALSRHTALRPQSVPSTWSNSSLKQHPGLPF